jgi:hypothetical protein
LEAPAGFEPAIMVLQTIALATWLWSRFSHINNYIKYHALSQKKKSEFRQKFRAKANQKSKKGEPSLILYDLIN